MGKLKNVFNSLFYLLKLLFLTFSEDFIIQYDQFNLQKVPKLITLHKSRFSKFLCPLLEI
jgi:hypothetical protein